MVKTDKEKSKRDYFSTVMIVQTVVCGIVIAFLFISASSDGEFASLMRSEYARLMTGDITAADMMEAFESVKEYSAVFSEKDVKNNLNEASTESESQAGTVYEADESETVQIGGGADLQFTSLDTLEGVYFEPYAADFSVIIPLEDYEITSRFGYRISPITGNAGIHTGLDMAADSGEPIYAAADGIVLDSAYDDSYGYYVKLQHEDNIVTIYAHCSELCVEEGEKVEQGDKIAEVGSTGDSTGNHLHFEMRKDNIRIDPEYALTGL